MIPSTQVTPVQRRGSSCRPFSGPALSTVSINIEGYSQANAEIVSPFAQGYEIVCMQETHIGPKHCRPSIQGMKLIAETRHRKYGSAVFAKPTLNIEDVHTEVTDSQIELITVSLANITITSVYKPPSSEFELPPLPEKCRRPLHLVIGDFNSHSTAWGYEQNDCNGDLVEAWAEASNFSLTHDAKLPKSFDSARWKRGYNPDVAFVSTGIASMSQRGELDPIPRTHHRPITITIRSLVTATHCPFRRRFNLKKANWSKFTNEIDQAIANIPAHPNHYTDFVDLVKKAARHNIPSGCHKEYIPGLSDESSDLLKLLDEEYNRDPFSESTIQLGDTLLDEISGERRNIWRDMVGNTNLIMNSKKAWATIRRLGADNVSPPVVTTVTADQIVNHLLSIGRRVEHRRPPGEHHKTIVSSNNQPQTELTKPFSLDELATGINLLKPGKAAGLDDVLS